MQYEEGQLGRIFMLRLEEGEQIPGVIEDFARIKDVKTALVLCLGGAADQSRIVVGPQEDGGDEIVPTLFTLTGRQEILAVGTLYRNQDDAPVLHMHAATGRDGNASVGCTRAGVDVWLIGEAVMIEITGVQGIRMRDPDSGFELLQLLTPGLG